MHVYVIVFDFGCVDGCKICVNNLNLTKVSPVLLDLLEEVQISFCGLMNSSEMVETIFGKSSLACSTSTSRRS